MTKRDGETAKPKKKPPHGQFTPRILAGQFGNVLDHEGQPVGEWRGPRALMPKPREAKTHE
jgi:hypothetical protein